MVVFDPAIDEPGPMRIEQLTTLCPPPSEPTRPRGDWDAVERDIGLRLPTDFKAVTEAYGEGCFANFLSLLHPFTTDDSCLVTCSAQILDAERQAGRDALEEQEYALHPETGGLFPWARSDNGDTLFWVTRGEPERSHGEAAR